MNPGAATANPDSAASRLTYGAAGAFETHSATLLGWKTVAPTL